jgi:hypothetical protein
VTGGNRAFRLILAVCGSSALVVVLSGGIASCRAIAPLVQETAEPEEATGQENDGQEGEEMSPELPTPRAEGPPTEVAQAGQPVTFRVLAAGAHCAVRIPAAMILSDEDSWQQVWDALHSNVLVPPERPHVDFHAEQIVVLVLGERPTAGYGVRIGSATERPEVVVVTVQVTEPASDAVVAQVLTTHFQIAAIPRFPKPVLLAGDDVAAGFVGD